MKKTLLMLGLIVGVLSLGISQAYAVPTVDGLLGVGEWANTGYPYYLEVFDPDEADNQIQNMDISHGILLQELNSAGGDGDPDFTPPFTGAGDNDGLYLLLEVYGPPPSLDFATGAGVVPTGPPVISLQGDFFGDGVSDPFNIFVRHYNTVPDFTPGNDVDKVEVCVGSLVSCSGFGAVYTDLTSAGGSFGRGAVLEYFFPSGTFGTPIAPFPFSFIGTLTYDNRSSGPATSDDVVVGTLIPEPGTMLMALVGLLGLAGFGRKFFGK